MLLENKDECGVTEQKIKLLIVSGYSISVGETRFDYLTLSSSLLRTASWIALENTSAITRAARSSMLNAAGACFLCLYVFGLNVS